jgi:hypothetical protein
VSRTKTKTLLHQAAENVGKLQAYRAVAFVVCWAIVEERLRHPPTLEEYAEWWGESLRTVFREQERFRRAFPGETTPQRLVDNLAANGTPLYKVGVSAAARIDFALAQRKQARAAAGRNVQPS